MDSNISVRVVTDSDSEHYDEYLELNDNGHEHIVPTKGVKRSFYDEITDPTPVSQSREVPDTINFTRVFLEGGPLIAEAWINPTTVVTMRGLDKWRVNALVLPDNFDAEKQVEIWKSPTKEIDELTMLLESGLTAAEALDFWGVWHQDFSYSGWGKIRGTSHQAVGENVRKAKAKLLD